MSGLREELEAAVGSDERPRGAQVLTDFSSERAAPGAGRTVRDLGDRIVAPEDASNERTELIDKLVALLNRADLPSEHAELASKIVVLDRRSYHALGDGKRSRARAEVKALLESAARSGGYLDRSWTPHNVTPINAARALYDHAEAIFVRHMENRNRLIYLGGVVGGIFFLIGVAVLAQILPSAISAAIENLPAYIWWAGLGSIVSVLLRLSKLDVGREISTLILIASGIGRPIVASALALVAYLIIHNKLISVSVAGAEPQTGFFFVVAFLCGFSERFAQDFVERTEAALTSRPKPT